MRILKRYVEDIQAYYPALPEDFSIRRKVSNSKGSKRLEEKQG
jgi:hypothetical protein